MKIELVKPKLVFGQDITITQPARTILETKLKPAEADVFFAKLMGAALTTAGEDAIKFTSASATQNRKWVHLLGNVGSKPFRLTLRRHDSQDEIASSLLRFLGHIA